MGGRTTRSRVGVVLGGGGLGHLRNARWLPAGGGCRAVARKSRSSRVDEALPGRHGRDAGAGAAGDLLVVRDPSDSLTCDMSMVGTAPPVMEAAVVIVVFLPLTFCGGSTALIRVPAELKLTTASSSSGSCLRTVAGPSS